MGAESEGGCRSDRRERRTSELKGEKRRKRRYYRNGICSSVETLSSPHYPTNIVLITLLRPSGSRFYSGCKAGDSGLHLSLLADRRWEPREGRKTHSGRSGTACPVSRRQGSPVPMSDRRPPTGLVGIPRPLWLLVTPTLPATEALEP